MGQCENKISYRGKNVNLIFIVLSSESAPILGLDSGVKLKLIQRVTNITQDNHPNFFAKFNDCFGDIDSSPKTHNISIKPEVTPTISPTRRLPIALCDKFKSKLDRVIKLDVIEPLSKPNEWVNPLVTVEKPNGKLRVCLELDPLYHNITLEEVANTKKLPDLEYHQQIPYQTQSGRTIVRTS